MAKKQETVTVPTGNYSIEMPKIVTITADVPVIQNKKEIKPQSSGLSNACKCCLLLATLLALGYAVQRFQVIEKLRERFLSPPGKIVEDNRVRYVIVQETYLYEVPQERCNREVPRYILQGGDPVESMGEVHQFPNGKTWMKVRYSILAGEHKEEREGWVDAEKITIQ